MAGTTWYTSAFLYAFLVAAFHDPKARAENVIWVSGKYAQSNSTASTTLSTYVKEVQKPAAEMTVIQCAAVCSKYAWCSTYSYQKQNSTAFCRIIGATTSTTEPASEAKTYSSWGQKKRLVDLDGFFVSRRDGFSYKRIPSAASGIVQARSVCTSIGAQLPVPYPESIHYFELQEYLQPGDLFYLGINRATGYNSERVFVTDKGVMLNASQKDVDGAQHWAPGQPNSMDITNGAAMVMTDTGFWDDVPITASVNTIVCSKFTGYKLENNGKFYRVVTTPGNWITGRDRCISEGGQLAIPYGAMTAQILSKYRTISGAYYLFVDGLKKNSAGYVWEFQDGTTIDERVLNQGDPARSYTWAAGKPQQLPGVSCMCLLSLGTLCDALCGDVIPYVCQRDF